MYILLELCGLLPSEEPGKPLAAVRDCAERRVASLGVRRRADTVIRRCRRLRPMRATDFSLMEIGEQTSVREIARHWLQPEFAATRILVAELHCAAIRQPEVAELLGHWQRENAERLEQLAGLSAGQVRMYYLLLVGLSHADQVDSLDVTRDDFERQIGALIDDWFRRDPT
jgi:hypothetical protein